MSTLVRIDFYILETHKNRGRYMLACRVADKAYRTGNKVFLKLNNMEDAQLLDDLLWTFSQSSFIPHQLCQDGYKVDSPVAIGVSPPHVNDIDVIISISDEPLIEFTRYQRIVEIVGSSDNEKTLGRKQYKYYKDHGIEPNVHKINS